MKPARVLLVLLVLSLSLGAFARPLQASSFKMLNGVQLIGQSTEVSCWAAVSAMIIGYYAHLWMSPGFASKVQDALSQFLDYKRYYASHGIPLNLWDQISGHYANAMSQFSVRVYTIWGGRLSFDLVMSEIDGGHPVFVAVTTGGNNGHVLLIVGYNSWQQTTRQVLIYDPWPVGSGAQYWLDFDGLNLYWAINGYTSRSMYGP